ncbi:MAG TPA: non-homologous end-joining DNA ligase [Thermoleophilaceae bacterium]|nr:non-homologous end-joining DNA ligase [Thermoleophilaceae bacterium]
MIEPMKAVLADKPFSDPDWIFERKLDGIRCLAIRDASGVQLMSRTGRRMNAEYPGLVDALEREPSEDFIADGEIVAFQNGITSFSRLQRRGRERVPVFLYLFDILRHEGEDLRERPLRERKARLRRALEFGGPLRFNPHRKGEHGEEVYREACEKGLEGVIAKRADSPYRSSRSRDWLKLKCHAEQELVIGGYTAPKGSRTEFGALLVGYYDDDGSTLRYAGKVGTGFDQHTLSELGARMRELEQDESPFERFKPIPPGTHWVRPELVGQVGFAEWTRDGRLRHPRYLGLRDDKPAREVVRELPS